VPLFLRSTFIPPIKILSELSFLVILCRFLRKSSVIGAEGIEISRGVVHEA